MFQTISFGDFCDAFRAYDRHEQFSYHAKRILFDWLEEYEADTGEPVELDIIALCCEYSESSTAEVADNYDINLDDLEESEHAQTVADYLQENTLYLGQTDEGNHVYASF